MNKENIKIALISLQQEADRVPPLGQVGIATYLRDRVGVKHIKIFDKNYHNLLEEVEKYSPDIIGIGAMTVNYKEAIFLARKLKLRYNAPIIIGGVHISTLPESFTKEFDVGVIGEGEVTLAELVNHYIKNREFSPKNLKKIKSIVYFDKGKLQKTQLREPVDLDTLPIPDFSFISRDYFKQREIPGSSEVGKKFYILTSRGCPYRCVFCSTSRFWGQVRIHSPEYVAKLIKNGIDNYGSDYFVVLDDLFTISNDRLKNLKQVLTKQNILQKIRGIECSPRANLIDDEMCMLLKELKTKMINFGFESGSDRVLKYLKGGSVTVEMNKRAILLGKKYGFNVYGSLMFGSPGETVEDMKQTLKFIDFAIKNKARYIWHFVSTPFPGTPFWDIALNKGKVSTNMDWDLLSHHNLDNPLLLDEGVCKNEFKEIFLKAGKKLRKLKLRLVFYFLTKKPLSVIKMLLNEPKYYLGRFIKQVIKQ